MSISSRPERAAFAGMGVEAGDGEPRLGDAELALQPADRGAALGDDRARWSAAPARRASGTWVVTGTTRSVGPASIIATSSLGDAAALGDELGLAGMGEADRVELRLGDRAGDERRGGARAGQPDREFERVERSCARRPESGWPGTTRCRSSTRMSGRALVETRRRLAGIVDRPRPGRPRPREPPRRSPTAKKGGSASSCAPLPALGDDFGADPRRIAQRDGERALSGALSDSRSPRRAGDRADSAARGG